MEAVTAWVALVKVEVEVGRVQTEAAVMGVVVVTMVRAVAGRALVAVVRARVAEGRLWVEVVMACLTEARV